MEYESPDPVLEQLYREIPLSAAMGVKIVAIGRGEVSVSAPLKPNSNHMGTAFGGSIHSLAVLASWLLISETLKALKLTTEYVVIQNSSIDYQLPVSDDFEARAAWVNEEVRIKFIGALKKKGLARTHILATVECNRQVCARFSGSFVGRTQPQVASVSSR